MMRDPSPALVALRPVPRPDAHLVCLPYAGGSPAAYAHWAPHVAAAGDLAVALWAVLLPGRERRIAEPPYLHVRAAVGEIAEAVGGLPGPVALFGHSLGALLAYPLAVELAGRGRLPVRLGLSGQGPRPRVMPDARRMSDASLLRYLRSLSGTPAEVLDHPDLVAEFLPTLRADLILAASAAAATGPRLACGASLFCGQDDQIADRSVVRGWLELVGADATFREYPGGHFFVDTSGPDLIRGMLTDLRQSLGDGTDPGAAAPGGRRAAG